MAALQAEGWRNGKDGGGICWRPALQISGTLWVWEAYNVARGRIAMLKTPNSTQWNPSAKMKTPFARAAGLLAALALAAGVAGCRIHVDKDANGEDKNVQVDTPFGGIHVNTDQTTAADLGLPVYPGAQNVADGDNDKSADIHMGFGAWEVRVKVVNYSSSDSQDKVEAFYKKALGRYGDVLTCQDNAPVGTPTATSEGLTCKEDKHATVQVSDRPKLWIPFRQERL